MVHTLATFSLVLGSFWCPASFSRGTRLPWGWNWFLFLNNINIFNKPACEKPWSLHSSLKSWRDHPLILGSSNIAIFFQCLVPRIQKIVLLFKGPSIYLKEKQISLFCHVLTWSHDVKVLWNLHITWFHEGTIHL